LEVLDVAVFSTTAGIAQLLRRLRAPTEACEELP